MEGDTAADPIIDGGAAALTRGALSWALLNQILHRSSEAGLSEGFFRYYFLSMPLTHPYPVDKVLDGHGYTPPIECNEIQSPEQLSWGFTRFVYDAMLFWGDFRQAYRDLRSLSLDEITALFAARRVDCEFLLRRGGIQQPQSIPRDDRYLISEMACKTYGEAAKLEDVEHVRLAVDAFRELRAEGQKVTRGVLRQRTQVLAVRNGQTSLFELMYEGAGEDDEVRDESEVVALYSGQRDAFERARASAIENTRVYLSVCNDLDVYVATSMRTRNDFREMAMTCERIFEASELQKYNLRYFDPTLSATEHHEDKGLIECLMVKTSKVLLYFAQHRESLGKVSEYAMALTLGKPVIVLCPDDERGRELYRFYRDAHPLMRLIHFDTGIVNGAMVTHKVQDAIELLARYFSGTMEYDLARKPGTDRYHLLKERTTGTTVRIITDDRLLTETFWNNWHGIN